MFATILKSALTALAAGLFVAACASSSGGGNQPTGYPVHTITEAELINHVLSVSDGKGSFDLNFLPDGVMKFKDTAGSSPKSGSGDWNVSGGKLYIKSRVYWTKGSFFTFFGPAADGSWRVQNNRDSRRTFMPATLH